MTAQTRISKMWRNDVLHFNAVKAKSVKYHEIELLNHGIINLSQDKFNPIEGVPYLWILTQDEEKQTPGPIYIGIENPLDYPEAFHEGISDYLKKAKLNLDQTISEIQKLAAATNITQDILNEQILEATVKTGLARRAHPTLAIKFEQDGKVVSTKAYMGGELYFENGYWYLNDKSGRYYHAQENRSTKDKEYLLQIVANQIEIHTANHGKPGIKPLLKVILNKTSPEHLWEVYFKQEGIKSGEVGVALIILVKLFKRHLTKAAYNDIKTTLYGMRFPDMNSLVNYLNKNEFMDLVQEKLTLHNQTKTAELALDINKNIDFLELKANELVTVSTLASTRSNNNTVSTTMGVFVHNQMLDNRQQPDMNNTHGEVPVVTYTKRG